MICVANWKMNHNLKTSQEFLVQFKDQIKKEDQNSFIFLAPTLLFSVFSKELRGTNIRWGGQNCFSKNSGAFTGENSPRLMCELGATHCLVGHSERRFLFGENQEMILKKVESIIENKMTPILCVGETKEQRKSGQWKDVMKSQLSGLASVSSIMIAYEPIWAIGSKNPASAEKIQEVVDYILQTISPFVPVLYGGSVNSSSAKEWKPIHNLSGFLIGRASLQVRSLISIYQQTYS